MDNVGLFLPHLCIKLAQLVIKNETGIQVPRIFR